MLAVMLRHYYMRVFEFGLPRWADIFGLGYVGVHLFLLLSGFCLSWAYVGDAPRPFKGREFLIRRATRILPAYYVAMVISAILAAPHTSALGLTWQLLTHATMTHNLFRSTVLGLNGPFWSLALECQLYVLFPLMLLGLLRIGSVGTLALVLLLQTVFRVVAMRYGTGYNESTFVLPWSVAGRLFEFCLGMCAAVLVARGSLNRIPIISRWALPLVIAMAFIVARWSGKHLGVTHPLTDWLWSVGFASLLLAASRPASMINRILSIAPIVKLGVFSYSVYLIHEIVLGYVTTDLLTLTAHRIHPLVLAPAAFGATVFVSYLFYRAVERPAIRFFREHLPLATHLPPSASPSS